MPGLDTAKAVGVIGAGTMGAGVPQIAAAADPALHHATGGGWSRESK